MRLAPAIGFLSAPSYCKRYVNFYFSFFWRFARALAYVFLMEVTILIRNAASGPGSRAVAGFGQISCHPLRNQPEGSVRRLSVGARFYRANGLISWNAPPLH